MMIGNATDQLGNSEGATTEHQLTGAGSAPAVPITAAD